MSSLVSTADLEKHYRDGHTVHGNLVISQVSDVEFMFTRRFDAPRELVFDAFLDPHAIPNWWGPARYTTTVQELDARPGGRWRFISKGADGVEYGFHGEFRELVRPERIVQTFEFEGMPGQVSIDAIDLVDEDGRTLMIGRSTFDSPEAFQGMTESGMEDGMAEGYDRLDTLLASQMANDIVVERVFDAPREVVWEAWTQPERFAQWYGPNDFIIPSCTMDVRVGGARTCLMQHGPDGMQMRTTGTYIEVVPQQRLVYTDEAIDDTGNPVPAPDGNPYQTRVTVTLEEVDGKTKLTLRHSGLPAAAGGARVGWTEGLDKLAATLARDIVIERMFDAPRELVWKAWTTPEHLMRWWAPSGWSTPVAKIDLRSGGKWHYCMRDPQGNDFWSTGTFREIVPLEKIVNTDSFANAAGEVVPASAYGMDEDIPLELLVTATFEDAGPGRTKVTLRHSGFPAGEHRGMAEQGWGQLLDKLTIELASMT